MPPRIPPPTTLSTTLQAIPRNRSSLPPSRRRRISTYGYTQAKTLIYSKHGEPKDVLSLHTHSIPPPHSTLLTLRTLAAPLNPADINQIQGTYPSLPPFLPTLGTPLPAAVPGNEACFEVLAAGSAVRGISRGDWVIPRRTGLGTWRTHLQVPAEAVLRVDKRGLRAAQVAGVGVNPVTAWRMLRDFADQGRRGDWVILNGANSGVGRAALQLGRLWGWRSIAVVRERAGLEGEALRRELEDLGATRVVSDTAAQRREFAAEVRAWTSDGSDGEVRLGLNCVGGPLATAMARVLAPGGHMVTYGAMSRKPMEIPAGLLIFKDLVFDGFWVSKWSERFPEEKERTVGEVLALMREGKLRDGPVVEVPWGEGTKEGELVEAVQGTLGGFRKGKGVLVFGEM